MNRKDETNQPLSDELLQRYHDGELSAAERAQVEARLDGDARARLLALDELGGLLRQHSTYEADEAVVSTSLAATIAAIERGAPAVTPPAATATTSAPPRRRMRVSMFATFVAGAAALALALWPAREPVSGAAQVERLEVSGSVATVFNLQSGDDPAQTATVIWAALDEGEEDDEATPEGSEAAPAESDEGSEAL